MNSHRWWITILAFIVGGFLLLYSMHLSAQVVQSPASPPIVQKPSVPLEFRVCGDTPNLRFKRNGDDVEVYCMGQSVPVFTLKGCIEPKVTRVGSMYKVLCVRWIPYDVVPKAAPQ